MGKRIKKIIKGGLLPINEDNLPKKDFFPEMLGGIFSYPQLPKRSFSVSEPRNIRNQGYDMTCTARTVGAILEDTEDVDISEEYQWMKTGVVAKQTPEYMNERGATFRQAFSVPVKWGALERHYSPMNFDKNGRLESTKPENYLYELDKNALFHKQKAYFRADKRIKAKDYFDSLVLSLWQNYQFNNKRSRSLGMGLNWYQEYNFQRKGVIDTPIDSFSSIAHAVKAFAYSYTPFTSIPGGILLEKEYLSIQNSLGEDVGEKGVFHLSREVVNQGERYGAMMLIDLTEKQLQSIINPPFWVKWWREIFK